MDLEAFERENDKGLEELGEKVSLLKQVRAGAGNAAGVAGGQSGACGRRGVEDEHEQQEAEEEKG